MRMCNEYIEALEEERRKIQVFQRELPLCLELITQVIEGCKQQLSGVVNKDYFQQEQEQEHEQEDNDCSDQTSSHGPILEDFITIRRDSSSNEVEEEEDEDEESYKKSDWLKSVQLWNNQSPDSPQKEDSPKNETVFSNKLHKDVGTMVAAITAIQRESKRKQRRCWSPELHRRFLNSIKQLGGAHVATPKQIKELMKVDGLSNDEVKSHLQKYRLHTKRPSSATHNNNNSDTVTITTDIGIYAPIPLSRSLQSKYSYFEKNGGHSTTSSTHTTTTPCVVNFSHHSVARVM